VLSVQSGRVQLQQVILNLILNAVEAMSAVYDGVRELLVGAEQSDTHGVLVVMRDSGPGIDPERRERVFDALLHDKIERSGDGGCRSAGASSTSMEAGWGRRE
jgi:C4-dicarboxylate-specific signal transduction histidine kinase